MIKKSKFLNTKSSETLNNFLEENQWVDVWRQWNDDQFQFTWKGKRGSQWVFSRLDYFMVPEGDMDFISQCEIWPGFLSDHSHLYMEIAFASEARGPGYWKINNSILENKEYVDEINRIIAHGKINI